MTASRKPTRAKALGVTDEEYERRLAEQGGGCAICGTEPKTRRLHVDHDHRSGEVRGLLCHRCNRALPTWVRPTWLLDAAAYLHDGPLTYSIGPDPNGRCAYCGVTIPPNRRTCFGHSDLPALDPLRHPALSSATSNASEGGRVEAPALTTSTGGRK